MASKRHVTVNRTSNADSKEWFPIFCSLCPRTDRTTSSLDSSKRDFHFVEKTFSLCWKFIFSLNEKLFSSPRKNLKNKLCHATPKINFLHRQVDDVPCQTKNRNNLRDKNRLMVLRQFLWYVVYTKKVHLSVDFCVGVDGFEPPTLCL